MLSGLKALGVKFLLNKTFKFMLCEIWVETD